MNQQQMHVEFANLLKWRKALDPMWGGWGHAQSLEKRWEQDVITAAKIIKPRRKNIDKQEALKLLGREFADWLGEPYHKEQKEYRETCKSVTECIDKEMGVLIAEGLLPKMGETPIQVNVHYGSTYASQGYGANRYAQGRAEQDKEHLQGCGVQCEVHMVYETEKGDRWGIRHARYEVWANLGSLVDWEICLRMSGQSLREWVRSCWAKGVNPRVYQPFLPAGFEEKHGLDYFGGELTEAAGQ